MINYLIMYFYAHTKNMRDIIHILFILFAIIYWIFKFIINIFITFYNKLLIIIVNSDCNLKKSTESLSPFFCGFSPPSTSTSKSNIKQQYSSSSIKQQENTTQLTQPMIVKNYL